MFRGRTLTEFPICIVVGMLAAYAMAFGQAPDAGGKAPSERKSPQPATSFQLKLGSIEKPSGRVATVPVYYNANKSKGSSNIRAEVSVPGSSWIFQAAEPPNGAWWKVSSKERGGVSRGSILELAIQGDARLLPDGVVAYLQFRLEPAGAPLPTEMTIKALDSSATGAGPRRISGSPGNSSNIPDAPPTNPSPGCFFFSH